MYGVATMVGVLLAVLFFKIREKRCKEYSADIELSFLYGMIGAVVGAKLLYVITIFPNFVRDIPMLFSDPGLFINNYLLGGFVFYGGFYGCILGVFIYCKCAKVAFDVIAQVLLPVFPLIHGFGRIGCFCMGCCYGKEAGNCPIGVIFEHSDIAPNGVPLLPVQLFEATMEFVLFIFLVILSYKGCSGYKMLGIYSSIYAIGRFLLEFLRGDEYRGFFMEFSTSQIISIITLFFAILIFIRQEE